MIDKLKKCIEEKRCSYYIPLNALHEHNPKKIYDKEGYEFYENDITFIVRKKYENFYMCIFKRDVGGNNEKI